VRGIDKWLTGQDESTAAGVGEGAHGGGNGGREGNLGARIWDWFDAVAPRPLLRCCPMGTREGAGKTGGG
jgi:hypothetical protein